MGFGGFRVLGSKVWGSGFGIQGLRFGVQGFRVQGFRVLGLRDPVSDKLIPNSTLKDCFPKSTTLAWVLVKGCSLSYHRDL